MTVNLPFYIIAAILCWRLTSLLVNEDGPFDVFSKFRGLFMPPPLKLGEVASHQNANVIAKMLSCIWCASIWVGLAIAIFAATTDQFVWYELVAMPFVLSAITIFIENKIAV